MVPTPPKAVVPVMKVYPPPAPPKFLAKARPIRRGEIPTPRAPVYPSQAIRSEIPTPPAPVYPSQVIMVMNGRFTMRPPPPPVASRSAVGSSPVASTDASVRAPIDYSQFVPKIPAPLPLPRACIEQVCTHSSPQTADNLRQLLESSMMARHDHVEQRWGNAPAQ